MPSETLNSTDSPYRRAKVNWGRDGQVQIATLWHGDGDHTPGGEQCHCVKHDWDGTFVTLDRDGCNRMIRALRKARDQAYGQDA